MSNTELDKFVNIHVRTRMKDKKQPSMMMWGPPGYGLSSGTTSLCFPVSRPCFLLVSSPTLSNWDRLSGITPSALGIVLLSLVSSSTSRFTTSSTRPKTLNLSSIASRVTRSQLLVSSSFNVLGNCSSNSSNVLRRELGSALKREENVGGVEKPCAGG